MNPPLIRHREKRPWPYELAEDWAVWIEDLKGRVQAPYHFRTEARADSRRGARCSEWLHLDPDGTLTVRRGYGTDGCTAAPDFPRALPACVLHDALRQATTLDPDCPWTRGEADLIFRKVMRANGFNWLGCWIYYLAVAGPTGWIYSSLMDWLSPPGDRVCGKEL